MDIQTRSDGDIAVLKLTGRFDIHTAAPVAKKLEEATSDTPAKVVVDLAGITFVDSTGLATLVQAMKRCRQREGELHLCGLQRPVYMIFELTRLDKAFSIFVDEDHAIKAFVN